MNILEFRFYSLKFKSAGILPSQNLKHYGVKCKYPKTLGIKIQTLGSKIQIPKH